MKIQTPLISSCYLIGTKLKPRLLKSSIIRLKNKIENELPSSDITGEFLFYFWTVQKTFSPQTAVEFFC